MKIMSAFTPAFSGTLMLGLLAGCGTPYGTSTAPLSKATQDFNAQFNAERGITDKTHGEFPSIKAFSAADVPINPPVRGNAFSGNGVGMLVAHSSGHSSVQVMYPVNASKRYSRSGGGAPIPLEVRINPPAHPATLYTRGGFRRLELSRNYTLDQRIHTEPNRAEIIALADEVIAKTHCRGGRIAKDASSGEFARAYGPRARSTSGTPISAGWVVSYTCSRWRAL